MSTFVQQEINNRNKWVYFTKYRWVAHAVYWTWVLVAGTLLQIKGPITVGVILNNFFLSNLNIAVFYYVYCLVLIPYFFKRDKVFLFWALLAISFFALTGFDLYFHKRFVHVVETEGYDYTTSFWNNYLQVVTVYVINFLIFSMMLFFMEKNEENNLQIEVANEKREIELVKLDLLKTNISPDFIMRSLDQLKRSALHLEPYTPNSIITFSEVLRYRLYRGKQASTPLTEELAALRAFIDFIRFDYRNNNLLVSLDCTGDPTGKSIAALSLINIMEPFCKVIPEYPAVLAIQIHITEDLLQMQMDYDKKAAGSLLDDLNAYGHDYRALYGESIHFNFENCEEIRCKIELVLPIS